MPDAEPVLLAVAHGTRHPVGRAQVRALVRQVRALDVRLAYVDVQQPSLPDVLATLDRPAVVVPLLLTAGYHVRVDIPAAVLARGADPAPHDPAHRDTAPGVVVAPPLGPDPILAELLHERLREAGGLRADAVVLAAAGSSDPRALADVAQVAADLAERLPVPVRVGYASAAHPRVPQAVAELRAAGFRRVAVASFLLADGFFHQSLAAAGADVVTRPLGAHPLLARLVLERYRAAASRAGAGTRVETAPEPGPKLHG
ncbi:cobalamin biosynthesis protein CbiX [Carbonactinospora thermoautotrophica]|uniref:sirohydrochlorin chelatase n=1 Tax=Carbonactinospora thermoautotrophica TaxID=1469144 RepID=UPI00226FA967|nr:sirohydrochlorin chelatase [Carbonactinospora thermoautotrophica]MCX9191607.1 cobalamin biosynthesis protein CbiX [Carbonactinospora thermoautotrophica]